MEEGASSSFRAVELFILCRKTVSDMKGEVGKMFMMLAQVHQQLNIQNSRDNQETRLIKEARNKGGIHINEGHQETRLIKEKDGVQLP